MKKAIILGGTHDHIKLIKILKDKRFFTILIDYYQNPPAAQYADKHIIESTTNKNKVLKISKEEKASLIISTCIDSSLATVAYVSEKLSLPCHISYETAVKLTNKNIMKNIFYDNKIPTSKFIVLSKGNYNYDNNLDFPIVVKPADSNSSKGISKIENAKKINTAIKGAYKYSLNKTIIIEEFKKGEELSIDVLVVKGIVHIIMISKNIKSQINDTIFTITQNEYVAKIDKFLEKKILVIAKKIAKAFCINNGPLLIQLINNNGNLSVIEFSSRIGGGSKHHLINFVSKFDLLNAFINQILGKNLKINLKRTNQYVSIFYLYGYKSIIKQYSGFSSLIKKEIISDYFLYKSVGQKIEGFFFSSDRPAGILISGNSISELNKKFKSALNKIKIKDAKGDNILFKKIHIND